MWNYPRLFKSDVDKSHNKASYRNLLLCAVLLKRIDVKVVTVCSHGKDKSDIRKVQYKSSQLMTPCCFCGPPHINRLGLLQKVADLVVPMRFSTQIDHVIHPPA